MGKIEIVKCATEVYGVTLGSMKKNAWGDECNASKRMIAAKNKDEGKVQYNCIY